MTAAVILLTAASAHAHGGPASVEVVAHNAAAPGRMAVGTSYGLAATHDGGATWSLTCEGAMGQTGSSHPRVAITSTGALALGLFTGAVRSDATGCSFEDISDMAGYVALDVQNVPREPAGLIALTRHDVSFQVWRSADDGESWSMVADDFGPKFQARSVGATSDPDRFYVGGLTQTDGLASLMITNDGGQSFTSVIVPDVATAPSDGLFVEAVDPNDPDTLVAALYEPPSKVLFSRDGGATWSEVFEGTTVLTGLAVSPAFDEIVTGSPALGLFRIALPDGEPEQISDLPVRCLTWTADALFVCADPAVTGYAVGRSSDRGETVEPLLELRCLQKPACDPSTQVEHACASEWPQLVTDVGIEACSPPVEPPDGPKPPDGGGGTGAGAGAGPSEPPHGQVAGGCASTPGRSRGWLAFVVCAAAVFLRRRGAA